MKYNYEKNNIEKIIKECNNITDVLRRLNILPTGGNYKTLKKYIMVYNIDISHFNKKRISRINSGKYRIEINDILIEKSTYTNLCYLKKRLLKNNLLEYQCYVCNISTWINRKLSLHLDHINGNNLDNRLENLRLLCPNCHSQTDTYCKRKDKNKNNKIIDIKIKKDKINIISKRVKKKYFCSCGSEIKKESKSCTICYHLNSRIPNRPLKSILLEELKIYNYCQLGRKYNVSHNTIRKWLK